MYEGGLGVARRMLRKALLRRHAAAGQFHPFLHGRQQAAFRFVVISGFVIRTLPVHFQKAVKLYHLALRHEKFSAAILLNADLRTLQTGIRHLAGNGAFPDQVIQRSSCAEP